MNNLSILAIVSNIFARAKEYHIDKKLLDLKKTKNQQLKMFAKILHKRGK